MLKKFFYPAAVAKLLPQLSHLIALAGLLFCQVASANDAPELPDPLSAGWQGTAVCEKLHEDDLQRILRCTFAPGVGHERHFHVAHFGYALSGGKMRIQDENRIREVELKDGSSYTSDGVKWHEVLNIGDTEVRYLIVETKPAN